MGFHQVGQPGLELLTSGDPPASAHAQLIFKFFVETRSHYISQAGLKFLSLSNSLTSASQSAGITGMSHCAQPEAVF